MINIARRCWRVLQSEDGWAKDLFRLPHGFRNPEDETRSG